jgi:hypothetical protein
MLCWNMADSIVLMCCFQCCFHCTSHCLDNNLCWPPQVAQPCSRPDTLEECMGTRQRRGGGQPHVAPSRPQRSAARAPDDWTAEETFRSDVWGGQAPGPRSWAAATSAGSWAATQLTSGTWAAPHRPATSTSRPAGSSSRATSWCGALAAGGASCSASCAMLTRRAHRSTCCTRTWSGRRSSFSRTMAATCTALRFREAQLLCRHAGAD